MADNEEMRRCVVNGYQFEDEKDYEEAANEKKAVKYLEGHINLNDTAKVLQLYNTLIAKNMFRTPIGLEYMRKLRAALQKAPSVKEELPYVRVPSSGGVGAEEGKQKDNAKYRAAEAKIKELEARCRKQRSGRRNSVILNIILIIVIIAMFIIAGNSSAPNIVNYERVITDKYSSWKEELTDKEEELRQRERDLEKRESEAAQ
ncbi:MAG: hypothetical protein NC223_07270 [Butyrivibrio sp.]|nr:hypothetical protein [Butyrivibrio sp.]